MTNPNVHLCPGLDAIKLSVVGNDVMMHIGRNVVNAPACMQVKMCAEFAVHLSADLQYTAAAALAPIFQNDLPGLKKLMTDMLNDAQEEIVRMYERRRNDAG